MKKEFLENVNLFEGGDNEKESTTAYAKKKKKRSMAVSKTVYTLAKGLP